MRLIDADALKKKLKLWCYNETTTTPTFSFITEEDIDECPTVVAVSREAVMRLIENKPYDWSNLTERHNMLMEIRKIK